ncbi:MAG: hypothetical protein CM15mP129_03250 [Chloroflexota bacterium]|nr:MAG: hypothetical protein CM15mP129_03250 [Chloroflexota bacterium]
MVPTIISTGEGSPHGGGFTRGGNGNSNDNFGNIGQFAADLTVSTETPKLLPKILVASKNQDIHYIMKETGTGLYK